MLNWLNDAVFYQIYPTSFFDYNGDGIGDLKGIESKVEYIKSLGVDAVWINPFYESPFNDGGYDISNYYKIDKKFGNLKDLKKLIQTFKSHGLKVIFDLVIGHTSDKHPWFIKSQKDSKQYSDYYIWADKPYDDIPKLVCGKIKNKGGYICNFYDIQPALNFGYNQTDNRYDWQHHYKDERLKPLRDEIIALMRFYLDMGIDGFRVDMAATLVKGGKTFNFDDPFTDTNKGLEGIIWLWNQIIPPLRKDYKDIVFIAEWDVPQDSVGKSGFDLDFCTHDSIFFNELYRNEPNTNLDTFYEKGDNYFSENGKGSLENFCKYLEFLYSKIEEKGCVILPTGTHDEIRMPTFKSHDLVKTIFAFLLSIKQVPMIYYGDEIGITHNFNVDKDGGGKRTGARTPMLWTEGLNNGFSTAKDLYLPINKQEGITVESQENDSNSLLSVVKKLIKIRKENHCLHVNSKQEFISKNYPCIIKRFDDKEEIIIAINPSNNVYQLKYYGYKVLIKENVIIENNLYTLQKQSFILLKKEI